jgi:putative drug exporter of the RND superfamily
MSTRLYRLALLVSRNAGLVVLVWSFLAVSLVWAAVAFGGQFENDYSIPGTESQAGIEALEARFPGTTGATADLVISAPSGASVTDPAARAAIGELVDDLNALDTVFNAQDPFEDPATGAVSSDGRYALSQIQLESPTVEVDASVISELEATVATVEDGSGLEALLGGSIYTERGAGLSIVELIGVAIAFVVLLVTFRSALAASAPLLMSFFGAIVALAGISLLAAATTVNSSTPSLAIMIVLAVGIDYGLFILSRYRKELASGEAVPEAMARAVATAGSAIVFAGVTVVVALWALVLAGIPFLSLMGVAAGASVLAVVAAALTLLPSILVLLGERLRPKRGPERVAGAEDEAPVVDADDAGRWGRFVARRPGLLLAVMAVALGVMATPALGLRLAIPDNGSAEPGSPARETFDVISTAFGPGYNGPLSVTAEIGTSQSPQDTVDALADRLRALDGVQAVTRATPNPSADLALVRVIPEYEQSDPRTSDLVEEIRAQADQIEEDLGVSDLIVTGVTAVSIDVSERLVGALLPFSLVVVTLSFLLAMMVFRSVAIPIKSTVGFMFSVGVAFAAVVLIFEYGWFAEPLNVSSLGPVVTFLPIMVLAILFGLSMDYEVFLVSRIREEYVKTGDAQLAIDRGYRHSQRVVNAAGVIMVAVFAAFVPHGSTTLKPMAIALAVGVFVDAFIIRATLARAVLVLLGDKAWWLPGWLDRALPHIDAEGEAIVRHVALREHEDQVGPVAVRLVGARATSVLDDGAGSRPLPDLEIPRGGIHQVEIADPEVREQLAALVTGRLTQVEGTVEVLGRVLPDEAAAIRRRTVACGAATFVDRHADAPLGEVVVDYLRLRRSRSGPSRRRALEAIESSLERVRPGGSAPVSAATHSHTLGRLERRIVDVVLAVSSEPSLLVVVDSDDEEHSRALLAIVDALATADMTALILANTMPWTTPATSPVASTNSVRPISDHAAVGVVASPGTAVGPPSQRPGDN